MAEQTKPKAVLWLGSPRKNSNSSIIGRKIMEGFQDGGGTAAEFDLPRMDIRPCTACDYCKTAKERFCVIEDDMEEILQAVAEADSLILASPIYWFHISAQMKTAVDRWYALVGRSGMEEFEYLEGKSLALAFAFGDADPVVSGAVNAYRSIQDACTYIGMKIAGTVYCSAEEAGAAANQGDVLNAAYELGKSLL
jgi:multimeric flavodoxin WrbA